MTHALSSFSTLHLTRPTKRRLENLVITSPKGEQVARTEAQGKTTRRLLMGNRRVTLLSHPDDAQLLTVTDPVNVFRDSFEVYSPSNELLARLVCRQGWKGESLQVTCPKEKDLTVVGSLSSDREFRLTADEANPTATWMNMSRQWTGVRSEMTDAASYILSFREDLDESQRQLCLGIAIAVDLHQLKKESLMISAITSVSGS